MMPDSASAPGREEGDIIPWATSPAAMITYRLALVATLTATSFYAILVASAEMMVGDHVMISFLIAGSFVATLLARRGKTYPASGIVIGTLWLCATSAIVVHGIRSAALPTLVMATTLAALWGGARLAIGLIALTCLALLATAGTLGPLLPPPVPTSARVDLIIILGQFVFLAALAGNLGRAIAALRDQFRVREQRLASATEELAVSRSALVETEARYAELVRALPELVLVLDETGRFIEVSDATREILGRPASDFSGRRMGEIGILAPQEVANARDLLRRLMSGEGFLPVLMPARHIDGSSRWLEVTGRRLVRPDGERRALVILRDVTDRKMSEQELVKRDALWRRASRIAQLGSWELDLEAGVLTWDDEVKRLHDVSADFVPDVATAINFYAPAARPVIQSAFETLLSSGTGYSLEVPLVTATGRNIYVRSQGEAEWRDGAIVKVFGIFQDITELHDATELLRETVKLEGLGRLAGGVAHDFNNLLTAILGYAEELETALPPGSMEREDVVEIRRAGERARELTMQLLAFARRQVVLPRVFDVGSQLEKVRRFLERLLGEDIALSFDVAPDAGTVRMDPTQFEQLLLNLAVNARDAMPSGGALMIRARRAEISGAAAAARELRPGSFVVLEVQDTGLGMAPEVADRVFEPFFTTKELGHGTGLGLATVYGVVRQAGGHIAVRSTVGRGTRFIVHLPRLGDEAPTVAERGEAEPRGGSETLLLVEDDDGVRTFAERVLRQAGYDVQVAPLGTEAEAIALAIRRPIALLVTDVVMPGMSGPQLAERLERRWPTLRTLFVSGYTQDRLSASRLGSGANFLAKPYGRQQLLEAVRAMLDEGGDGGGSRGRDDG